MQSVNVIAVVLRYRPPSRCQHNRGSPARWGLTRAALRWSGRQSNKRRRPAVPPGTAPPCCGSIFCPRSKCRPCCASCRRRRRFSLSEEQQQLAPTEARRGNPNSSPWQTNRHEFKARRFSKLTLSLEVSTKEAVITVQYRITRVTVKPSGCSHTGGRTRTPEQKKDLLLFGAVHVGTASSTYRARVHRLLYLLFLDCGPTFR